LARLGVRPLSGGMNTTAFVCTIQGAQQCIKLYKANELIRAEREWATLCLLAAQDVVVAPQPIWFDPRPQMPMIVMTFVPGQALGSHPVGVRELRALAHTLQRMYALVPAVADYAYTVVGTPTELIRRLQVWSDTQAERAPNPISDVTRRLFQHWLQSDDPLLLQEPAPVIFGRGDPNLANCLWDGAQVHCVNFEHSGWSDLAVELGDLLEGPSARQISDEAWTTFLACFDLADATTQRRLLAARRLCALYWIPMLWRRVERGNLVTHELAAQLHRAQLLLKQT
jgi:hypothetical protein